MQPKNYYNATRNKKSNLLKSFNCSISIIRSILIDQSLLMATSLRLSPNICPYLTNEVYEKLAAEKITNSITFLLQNPEELSFKTRISYKVRIKIYRVYNEKYS